MTTDPLLAAMEARHAVLRQEFGLAPDTPTWDSTDRWEQGEPVRYLVPELPSFSSPFTHGHGTLAGLARVNDFDRALVRRATDARPIVIFAADLLPTTDDLLGLQGTLPELGTTATLAGALTVVWYDKLPIAFYADPVWTAMPRGALLDVTDPAVLAFCAEYGLDTADLALARDVAASTLLLPLNADAPQLPTVAMSQALFTQRLTQFCRDWGVVTLPVWA